MPSRALEDYLKVIYKLAEPLPNAPRSQERQWVQTSVIAERLQLSQPSVSKMLKKLSEKEFIEHKPYHGVRLTEAGRRVALGLIRKHRILEQYLVEKLGYQWDEVDAEAEVLEHTISDKLANQMWKAMGKPTHDPHGSPIPTEGFELPEEPWQPLNTFEVGARLKIQRIHSCTPEALRYLESLHLTTGQEVKVVQKAPLQGPISLAIVIPETETSQKQEKEKTVVIDYRLAEAIWVENLADSQPTAE